MTLEKATIVIEDKAAIDESRGLPRTITVQFNPTEYSLNTSPKINEVYIYGIELPILQFGRGQTEQLQMELFFDVTETSRTQKVKDVRKLTHSIYQLAKIQPKTHALPRIRFIWGSLVFPAIVTDVQQKFTLFDREGIPLRATVSTTFRKYLTLEEQLKSLNLQSADHTKRHVVQRGETLSRIAAEAYEDPNVWREIAKANNLSNPRRLPPGTVLVLPLLENRR